MTGKISLTASMRSNLLSLQNISRQVSATQNKLATGNKVNSAIDNPSSYYTARALNNRADDLNALLDSMGQAVSTIKAATTALETGAAFLEQAAAVATQALETATIPAKSYFEEKVGENGAVVATAQELKDAIASGKETICVYGTIDFGQNDSSFSLQANQKLVGIEYFGNFGEKASGFSHIIGSSEKRYNPFLVIDQENNEISDLTISFTGQINAIKATKSARLQNLNINYLLTSTTSELNSAVKAGGPGTELFIKNITINSDRTSKGADAGINAENQAKVFLDGDIRISSTNGDYNLGTINWGGKNDEELTILSTARVYLKNGSGCPLIVNKPVIDSANQPNRINIQKGAELAVSDGETTEYYRLKSDFNSVGYDSEDIVTMENITKKMDLEEISPWTTGAATQEKPQEASQQYVSVLSQYDSLISDATYKGINLLQNDRLGVNFNESRSASLSIQGKDMSSAALGLTTLDWQTQGDIAQSLSEISAALKSIRSFSTELGNNYSIITSRQDFTENLINILTEGADKLTLADMNEESANMLALQTRQQLAVNSLSLASQASQSVLRLF